MTRFILAIFLLVTTNLALGAERNFENRLVCLTEKSLKEMINFVSDLEGHFNTKTKFNFINLESSKLNCHLAKIPIYKRIIKSEVYENGSGYFYILAKVKYQSTSQDFYFTDAVLAIKDWSVIKNCNLVYKNSNKTCLFPKECNFFSKYFFKNKGIGKSYLLLPANCSKELI
jgi:hypothetical protein